MSIQTFELSGLLDECDIALLNIQIASFDLEGDALYIGTKNGLLIHFVIASNSRKSAVFSTQHLASTKISNGVSVKYTFCSLTLGHILCVCDEQLYCVNADSMQLIPNLSHKIKNIVCVAVNERSMGKSDSLVNELVVGTTRKTIQVFSVGLDRIVLFKQVSISEVPVAIAIDGGTSIYSSSCAYYLANILDSKSTTLFTFDKDSIVKPFVKTIGPGEFILNGPNALGMFANSNGVSQMPPLTWSRSTFAVAFNYPYVIALDDEFLTIHSILDQVQKQSIPSPGWCHLRDTGGKVILGSQRDLLVAMPLSAEQQINSLLSESRFDEALIVLDDFLKNTSKHTEDFYAFKRKVEQKCGLYKLKKQEFSQAKKLLVSSDLPIESLIGMWPSLSSVGTRYKIKEINIDLLVSNNDALFNNYASFFVDMIFHYRSNEAAYGECFDACAEILINLLGRTDVVKLLDLVKSGYFLNNDSKRVEMLLLERKQYSMLICQYLNIRKEKEASDVCRKLLIEEVEDPLFAGLSCYISLLLEAKSDVLVLDSIQWLCEQGYLDVCLSIALSRSNFTDKQSIFYPSNVCSKLDYYPNFTLNYLEAVYKKGDYSINLTLCRKFCKAINSKLEESNVENISAKNLSESDDLTRLRLRCQMFLEESSTLDLNEALDMFEKSSQYFKIEKIILMRRLGKHNDALTLILSEGHSDNFELAVSYCEKTYAERDENLFEDLLDLLTDNSLSLKLIKMHGSKISPPKILQYIPDDFKLKDVCQHVSKALRCQASSNNLRRLTHMSASQVAMEYKKSEMDSFQSAGHVLLDDDSTCAVCNGPFFESSFLLFPQSIGGQATSQRQIVHITCAKRTTETNLN